MLFLNSMFCFVLFFFKYIKGVFKLFIQLLFLLLFIATLFYNVYDHKTFYTIINDVILYLD